MKDKEFLQWIHDRLVEVHGENKDYDYMHRLRRIIESLPAHTSFTKYEPCYCRFPILCSCGTIVAAEDWSTKTPGKRACYTCSSLY